MEKGKEVEEALGSVGRIRILRELAREPERSFSKYSLIKATGLKREDLNRNLKRLTEAGWVKEVPGTSARYQINTENPKAQHLIEFFKKAEYI